jgi:hypothetical protein
MTTRVKQLKRVSIVSENGTTQQVEGATSYTLALGRE